MKPNIALGGVMTLYRGNVAISFEKAESSVRNYLEKSDAVYFYDGTNSGPHNELEIVDLLALNALNAYAGAQPAEVMSNQWAQKDKIDLLIPAITTQNVADLEEHVVEREKKKIQRLLNKIEEARLWGGAGTRTAKLAHRLRPNIIPLWDSFVGEWYSGPQQEWPSYLDDSLADIVRNNKELKKLATLVLEETAVRISIVRVWDIVLWSVKNL